MLISLLFLLSILLCFIPALRLFSQSAPEKEEGEREKEKTKTKKKKQIVVDAVDAEKMKKKKMEEKKEGGKVGRVANAGVGALQ